jgi:membrane-associated phospholipid phosphatase
MKNRQKVLKYSVPRERPEGSDTSGHTSAAFSGATFIHRRYGWKYGIPAYLAVAFVGWSRVESGKHYSDDVLRGTWHSERLCLHKTL